MILEDHRGRVAVPPELQSFVEYLRQRGYATATIATILRDLRPFIEGRLTYEEAERAGGQRGIRKRYAYRRYLEWLKSQEDA